MAAREPGAKRDRWRKKSWALAASPIPVAATAARSQTSGASAGPGLASQASASRMFSPSFLILVSVEPAFGALLGSRNFYRASLGIAASFVGLLAYVTGKFALDVNWDSGRLALLVLGLLALWRRLDILWIVAFAAGYALLLL